MIMKKLFIITLLIVNHINSMQLIKTVRDWKDERSAHLFIQNFGSESFAQECNKMMCLSSGVRAKIFQKSEERDKELKHQLFSGAIILAALPSDLQKKIFEEIDPVFTDQKTTEQFLSNRSLKDALCWHAYVCKTKTRFFTLVHKKELHRSDEIKKSVQLTKQQLLGISLDEAFCLKNVLIDVHDQYICGLRPVALIKKNELIALNQLMQRKYLILQDNAKVLLRVKPKINLLFKIIARLIIPLVVHFYVRSCLSNRIIELVEPKINNDIHAANDALDRFEKISGEGPFLRHILHKKELVLDNTLLLYFVPSIFNSFILFLSSKLYGYDIFWHRTSSCLTISNLLMFVSFICPNSMLIFDYCDFLQWIASFMFYPWNEGAQDITIPVQKISHYLNSRWITIK